MSRLLLSLLILGTLLAPAKTHAQSNQNEQSSTSSFGQNFLYGNQEEEEGEDTPPIVWQYSNKYKKNPVPTDSRRILPQGQQYIYFVRTAEAKNNEAVLRLVTPLAVNGCVNVVPPTVTMRRSGNVMAFKIEDGDISVNKSVRYAHFQCNQGSNYATADIKINREDLHGVKALTFQTGNGAMDTYMVELTNDTLVLLPKSAFAFQPFTSSARPDPLLYRFYPDNLVVLFAPQAPKNTDLSQQISSLAFSKGMTESPLKSERAYYFIDQSGMLSNSLGFDANAYVGTITIPETFQGANGSYERENTIDVYARRPGMLD